MLKINKVKWRAFSAHISGNHNHVSRYNSNIFKLNGLNRRDKITFGAMPIPIIPSLTVFLEKVSDKLAWISKNGSPSAQYLAQTSVYQIEHFTNKVYRIIIYIHIHNI